MTHTLHYEVPVYPGWRLWLWKILRIKRPLWNEYVVEGVKFSPPRLEDGQVVVEITPESVKLVRQHYRR